MTHATSGPEWRTPFAFYDPAESCWRTSQATFLSGSDLYSETWPRSGMTRAGFAYELPMPVLPTVEPASSLSLPTPRASRGASGTETMYALGAERTDKGRPQGEVLLPTPTCGDAKGALNIGHNGDSLTNAVRDGRLLPTPTANVAANGGSQHPDKRRAGGHQPSIQDVAEHLFPTPTARDWKDGAYCAAVEENALLGRVVWQFDGASMRQPSDAGSASQADQLPGQLSLDEPASD